jgi:hypothetical protein
MLLHGGLTALAKSPPETPLDVVSFET